MVRPRIEALLVDFFGTLARLDDEGAYLAEVASGLSKALNVGEDKALDIFVKARRLANSIREAALVEIPVEGQAALIAAMAGGDWRATRDVLVNAMMRHLVPLDGAVDFLRWASQHFKVAIISNITCKCFIENFIKNNKININNIITSDVIRYRKPHKLIFKMALRSLRATPANTVMIGDDDVDLGARALGILTIIVGDRVAGDLNFKGLEEVRGWLSQFI
ncbi:MAG: HAD family hydrolase [Thermoproteus sp. AZ2]|uniref:HAD family hydrolase n=1 Tax=Thermoproteus sp. AZ2 TaxID=1609232 RepID=A0ACC6V0D1_9CREN